MRGSCPFSGKTPSRFISPERMVEMKRKTLLRAGAIPPPAEPANRLEIIILKIEYYSFKKIVFSLLTTESGSCYTTLVRWGTEETPPERKDAL